MTRLLRHSTPSILAVAVLSFAATAHAEGFVPLAPTPSNSKLGQLYQSSTDLGGFLSILFMTALSVGAIIAVLRLAYAGYQYMTTDAWGDKLHAKQIIGDVVLGLLLLLGVWLILKQINPQILQLDVLKSIGPGTINVPSRDQSRGNITITPVYDGGILSAPSTNNVDPCYPKRTSPYGDGSCI